MEMTSEQHRVIAIMNGRRLSPSLCRCISAGGVTSVRIDIDSKKTEQNDRYLIHSHNCERYFNALFISQQSHLTDLRLVCVYDVT